MRRLMASMIGLTLLAAAGMAADKPATEEDYRAHFAKQTRNLYTCGVIWSEWRWPKDRSKWDWDGRSMDRLKEMGATGVWINIPWVDVEPKQGQWYWDYVDHQVAEAEKRGLTMFAYTGLTPDWALPPEAPKDKPGIGYRFPPPDDQKQAFTTYCRKVAERYKGRIKRYWFWNEPNGCGWVNEGCANGDQYALYTKWLKIWYTAMKEVDPDCVLAAGAIDYNSGVREGYKYLEGMYREGAKGYFDAFSIHPYDEAGTLHHRAIEDTRRVMVEHGDGNKGIWVSEYGWPMTDEEEKSQRVTRTLRELNDPKYYYVTMALYLSVTDPSRGHQFGLCDDDLKPRPSFQAFKEFTQEAKRAEQNRARSAGRPRYLYGCGIIWAKWLEKDWSYDAQSMDMIKAMGGTSCPINIPWIDVEEKEGQWSFDYVDHQVAEAEKRGLAMFAYMGLTPDWALPPEAPKNVPGIGYRFPPPDSRKEQFITYCKKVARRYKGRVQHYQFWNEPNGCSWVNDGCGNGHVQDLYTKWLKIWYTAMKSEDPDCILGAGALDYHEGVADGYKYLEGMYRYGAKDHFDAFNIHPYDRKGTLHHRAIEDTRRVMVEHGDGDKGIWISEWGWNMKDEEEKARRITKALAELNDPKYHYVTMANYLSISDPAGEPGFGLCDRDLTPRKSYEAFKRFTQEQQKRAKESPSQGATKPQK